jgi:hypothetical protein
VSSTLSWTFQHRLHLLPAVLPELNQLTGIAAILTFPLDVEVVEAEEKAYKEEEERKRLEEQNA